jgi:hypothetical protein
LDFGTKKRFARCGHTILMIMHDLVSVFKNRVPELHGVVPNLIAGLFLTQAGPQHPQHLVAALARLAEAVEQTLGANEQLPRIRDGAQSRNEKKDVVWFARGESRPLLAFAGI